MVGFVGLGKINSYAGTELMIFRNYFEGFDWTSLLKIAVFINC